MTRRFIAAQLFLAIAGIIALIGSAGEASAAAPAIKISSATGHPTASVKITGSGFGSSEAVDIYFDTTDEILVVTNSMGRIVGASLTVPANATPGIHWVTAVGRRDGDAAQRAFTVETDWVQSGFGPRRKGLNPYENVLAPGNVSSLDVAWMTTTVVVGESSPAVANGMVYVGSEQDDKLYALDASTGAVVWSVATGFSIESSPAVANGIVYVGSEDDSLHAFNATTGATLWASSTGGEINSSPTVAGGVVYVGSEDGDLYAFNAAHGCCGVDRDDG